MPKYYIKSGHIKSIIDAMNHRSAIIKILNKYKGKGLIIGPKICIGEQGFENFKTWTCYETKDFLNKTL